MLAFRRCRVVLLPRTALVVFGLTAAVPAVGQLTNPVNPGTESVYLSRIATLSTAGTGNGAPIDLTHANDASGRLFVATHGGQIRLIKNGSLVATPFLNVYSAVGNTIVGGSGSDERGLLGITFHPDFAVTTSPGFGKFYTHTSETVSGNADFGHAEIAINAGNHQGVIREWNVAAGSDTANTTSRIVMKIMQPQSNHNGGVMKFGPDKMLYVSIGDGGGSNDFSGSKDSNTDGHTNVTGNGQDFTNVYGKVLRIDPLAPSATPTSTNPVGANNQYRIPSDNPFAGSATNVKEIYAGGFRNIFRMSFDKQTGTLYAGDVGQGSREEVNIVNSGMNYGWPYLEGTLDNSNYAQTGAGTQAPIAEYTHAEGISITGGYVYRGNLLPGLAGQYIFGDYRDPTLLRGKLMYMPAAGGTGNIRELLTTGDALSGNLFSFGEDASGELYVLMNNGDVFRMVPEPAGLLAVGTIAMLLGLRRRGSTGSVLIAG